MTEVGTMNLFVVVKSIDGSGKELWTAPLDGTILEGVTRDSILGLARERLVTSTHEKWTVHEKKFTMRELAALSESGRLLEVFGAGTAAVVSPVRNIKWRGRDIGCGLKPEEEVGDVTKKMKSWIEGIQMGREEGHEWSWRI